MKLLIVSHTPHYRREGQIVGWGATVREIDELATLFESVVHIAPLYRGIAPATALPYNTASVTLRAVEPAGGAGMRDKLGIPLRFPAYARAIWQEQHSADVFHVRTPANISLLALILMALLPSPRRRWVKYAGDWSGGRNEPWSYRFQRFWLARRLHRGVVTINGRWPNQPSHVASFPNPCLTDKELAEGREAAVAKTIFEPVRLRFVGRLESAKGAGVCLEIVRHLRGVGLNAHLDLVGDGDERRELETQAHDLGVCGDVTFHGGVPRNHLGTFYRQAHFILLPSVCSEGWPKVLSEAMAYGVVPVATAISSIPQFLEDFSTGMAICSRDAELFSAAIKSYLGDRARWHEHSRNAVHAADQFGYGSYLQAVRKLLRLPAAAEAVTV